MKLKCSKKPGKTSPDPCVVLEKLYLQHILVIATLNGLDFFSVLFTEVQKCFLIK